MIQSYLILMILNQMLLIHKSAVEVLQNTFKN